jgi:trans-L-3-hydroxyproline dehydratase
MNDKFKSRFEILPRWNPPNSWITIKTIDAHTAGEPLRIILSGLPEIKGDTILEKRKYLKENLDYIRTALIFEPRGHADMYGCIITPPVTDAADFGVIFLHNNGYSTMCGHAIIALTKLSLQTGMIEKKEPLTTIRIDTPAGLVSSYAKITNGKIDSTYFHNVPSFVLYKNQQIDVNGIGSIKFDIAFGGAFYAFVNADALGIGMNENNYIELIEKGMLIKNSVMENFPITHPFENDLNFLYGTIFYGAPLSSDADSRNVCIFAEGEVDRSPTGTGISARLAIHYDNYEIKLNEPMIIESIIGTKFIGSVIEESSFGHYKAVISKVQGNAFITGRNEFIIDPDDPLKNGFILR